ncbi:MAG: hypothetical protein AB7K24_22100 [Gemmataceae bacterium]
MTLATVIFCLLGYLLTVAVLTTFALSHDRVVGWRLEYECKLIEANTRTQLAIVDEVIAGDYSLAEAGAEFQRLHARLSDEHRELLARYYPEGRGPCRFERRVIDLVEARLQEHPEEQAFVIHRLERELEELKRSR